MERNEIEHVDYSFKPNKPPFPEAASFPQEAFAGVHDGEADDLAMFVTYYDVVISQFAVVGVTRFFEIYIQHIRFGIVCRPQRLFGGVLYGGNHPNIFVNGYRGHTCILLSSESTRLVRKAVMMNPAWSISR